MSDWQRATAEPGAVPEAGAGTQPTPFPREQLTALVKRMPAYGRLAWALARDPRLSKARRAALVAGAAYVFSPIDAIPGVIPVIGQLDDIAIALGVIRLALDGLKPEVRVQKLAAVGLSEQDLADDVEATKGLVVWVGRAGLRTGRRFAGSALQASSRMAELARERGGQAAERALEGGGRVAGSAVETGGRLVGGLRRRLTR